MNLQDATAQAILNESNKQREKDRMRQWGCMTEQLHFHFSLSCKGEGYGNPLQCSCLEDPTDRGAWQATVHAVAESDRLSNQHFLHLC